MPKAERDPRPDGLDPATAQAHAHEAAILGCLLDYPEQASIILPQLDRRDFLLGDHQLVIEAAQHLPQGWTWVELATAIPEQRDVLSRLRGEVGCTPTNLAHHLAALRQLAHDRRVRKALQVALDSPNGASPDLTELRAILEQPTPAADVPDLIEMPTLLNTEYPPRDCLLGEGLVLAGSLSMLSGREGSGKSYLLLMQAVSLARGQPWLTLAAPCRPLRVGYLAIETDVHELRDRYRILAGLDARAPDTLDANLAVLCPPDLRVPVNLLDQRWQDYLARQAQGRDLLIIEPLIRLQVGSLNDDEHVMAVLNVLETLRLKTGCAIEYGHHDRKGQPGTKGTPDPKDAPAGFYMLQAVPTVVWNVAQLDNHLLRLHLNKANQGREHEDIYIQRVPRGIPLVVDAPGVAAQKRRSAILEALHEAGHAGVTVGQLAARSELSHRRIRDILDEVGAISVGKARATRWYPASGASML